MKASHLQGGPRYYKLVMELAHQHGVFRDMSADINPLKTKHMFYRWGTSSYRAVNARRLGYKNQPVNVV
jgi:hypothetical protein